MALISDCNLFKFFLSYFPETFGRIVTGISGERIQAKTSSTPRTAIMIRILLMSTLISSTIPLTVQAGGLYFQRDSTIIRSSEDQKTLDTVWRAPFAIQDVSVSRNGHFICFTKSAVPDESRPEREVGFYSVSDGKLTVIHSNSQFNFGALISPSNTLVAFNYLPANSDWKTAIYDRTKQVIQYDVAPAGAGNSCSVFGWRSDSLLLFQTLDKIFEVNIFDHSNRIFSPPDSDMEFTVTGTQMVFLNDSTHAFLCEDDVRSMFEEFEGPPSNIFINEGRKTTRLFTGKEDANTCFLSHGCLYVGYTDYGRSKKGKQMLMRYDLFSRKRFFLKPIGTLVGIFDQ